MQLRLEVERKDFGDYGSRKVEVLFQVKESEGVCLEVLSCYYLGASYALYLQTIHRDDAVKRRSHVSFASTVRSDTARGPEKPRKGTLKSGCQVDTLRDVLKDILHSVEIYSSQPEAP